MNSRYHIHIWVLHRVRFKCTDVSWTEKIMVAPSMSSLSHLLNQRSRKENAVLIHNHCRTLTSYITGYCLELYVTLATIKEGLTSAHISQCCVDKQYTSRHPICLSIEKVFKGNVKIVINILMAKLWSNKICVFMLIILSWQELFPHLSSAVISNRYCCWHMLIRHPYFSLAINNVTAHASSYLDMLRYFVKFVAGYILYNWWNIAC